MNLKDLPGYIRSIRAGGVEESPVVNMGQIVSRPNWTKRFAFAVAFCLLGLIVYSSIPSNITVVVDAPGVDISRVIEDGGGRIISVSRNDDSTYSIRLATRKNVKAFLDLLRKNKDVRNVELER